jgi:hypothetical protein
MKIHAPVASCDEFLHVCIVEICRQSTESVFNHLHFFTTTHARATQKLLQVCEQGKITWSQVRTVGRMKKENVPGEVSKQHKCASGLYCLTVAAMGQTHGRGLF